MAKRFIDTGFLDQKWIRKLSPEKKIFIIYLMLKCDNGGIIDLDMDDAEFWIGKKLEDPQKFLPPGFLIPVIDDKHFIPKFLKWQYPNFPNSKVNQQKQGIKILTELKVFDPEANNLHKTYLTFTQTLPNSEVIVNDSGNVDDNENGNEPPYKKFYREEWEVKSNGHPLSSKYQHIVKYMMNLDKNIIDEPGEHILKLKKQLSFDQFVTLHEYCSKRATTIKEMVDSWLNTPAYSKGKVSVYANLQTWARKVPMVGSNFQENKKPIIQTSIGK